MNKKLIALAIAGATLAPVVASAQTANPVTLYGRVYETVESVKADGGSAAPIGTRTRVTDNASALGVRGTEDLGGIKAFFQLETGFRADVPTATFATRNSGVGLQGDFGSILIGRWDTPFKVGTTTVDPFGDLTAGGTTAVMNDRGNFDRRENNNIQYWSPTIGGFQGRLSWATNENKTPPGAGPAVNPSGLSASATYTQGPIYAGYSWEQHKDQFKAYSAAGNAGAVPGGNERGQALFGTFTFGPVKVGALAEWFKKENFVGTTKLTGGSKSQMFNVTYTIGNNQLIYQYMQAKDGTTRTSALNSAAVDAKCKANILGYFYNFSRRTSFLAQYVAVKNEITGQCDFGNDKLGVAADQDPRALTVGLRHVF